MERERERDRLQKGRERHTQIQRKKERERERGQRESEFWPSCIYTGTFLCRYAFKVLPGAFVLHYPHAKSDSHHYFDHEATYKK